MTPILQQFLSESRDCLQGISEKLIQLERAPDDATLMSELFRLVHTQKGNCGLFEFPEMSRVLHAAEDLMATVRDGRLAYSQSLADRLFDAMDFVSLLCDEIATSGTTSVTHAGPSAKLAMSLRELISIPSAADGGATTGAPTLVVEEIIDATASFAWEDVPEVLRQSWRERVSEGNSLLWVSYAPEPDCFFKGEDPFFQARQTPQVVWQRVLANEPWPKLAQLDAYRCAMKFELISTAPRAVIEEHFRYVPEQVKILPISPALAEGTRPAVDIGAKVRPTLLAVSPVAGRTAGASASGGALADSVIGAQLAVLSMSDQVRWLPGRLQAVAGTLIACYRRSDREHLVPALNAALAAALLQASAAPLRAFVEQMLARGGPTNGNRLETEGPPIAASAQVASGGDPQPVRRAEDASKAHRTLKVEESKIDRLTNLIGEMVVTKNALPYLAGRAESVFGVRELSREIKSQYAVINRIAEEMQDAIIQVTMTPVSFIFQRFPRLVRDVSRKLGKEVRLVLEGEDTEADKNIIEALADPLIHIVRNCLDHGIESPEVRRAAGKPPEGRLLIRASQEADRVIIDISDDGKGIDPQIIKRKAYEKRVIDEAELERITDQDAINLVFAAGFSTAEAVSDLSGRGVGMDVVRTAVERVNGTVTLESTVGQGTRLRLSLPLSMAVTNVMIIESDKQVFGVPMDMVVETVRVPRASIHTIKDHQTTVLRGRVVPLRTLNGLLSGSKPQLSNAQDEFATLVIKHQSEQVGIVVDDFREVVDIILKPMSGILTGLPGYAGSALLGDGSVLMVLNPKELM